MIGICTKFPDLGDAKIEEKKYIHQRKIISHKTVFTWFSNLPMSKELQGSHYFQGKLQSAAVQFFLSKKKSFNPNLQNKSFYFLRSMD